MQILVALLLDAIFGDPKWPPHPVTFVGRLITFMENYFYPGIGASRETARKQGLFFCVSVLAVTAAAVALILFIAGLINRWLQIAVNIYLLYAAIAFKSLKDESLPVADYLTDGNLERARKQVSRIVGRDTDRLDEEGVTRAAVETVAESYIDGVASVLFWMTIGAFFGHAAIFTWLFKASSTMDSMVGYQNERYRDFGTAAARLDDVLNFIPARLGAVIAICAGALIGMDYRRAWRIFVRDRLKHKSPNSAHGESVFAGLLGIRLGGGAFYSGEWESRPYLGDDLRRPVPEDILRAHHIMNVSVAICAVLIFALVRHGL